MKVYNRRTGIILIILALLVVVGMVVVYVNYKSVARQLRAEHKKGVELIREYWAKEPVRPVLRGESLPGNGGPKLAELLDRLESERPFGQKGLFNFANSWKLGGDSMEESHAYGKKLLPEVREALQHESCRLPFDYVGPDRYDDSSLHLRITNQVMFLGSLLLENGRREAALRDVADSIRLTQDLGRGTGLPSLQIIEHFGLGHIAETMASLLHEHPFPPEALETFLAEVRVLSATRPVFRDGSVVEEYLGIIPYAQFMEGHLTGHVGHDLVAGTAVSVTFLRTGGLRLKEYHESWEEFRRIVDLEYEAAEAEEPAYLEMTLERAKHLIHGSPDPLGSKRVNLEGEMILACLEAAVLAHLCRIGNDGVWPETLEGCGELPRDPWDGAPIRYSPPVGGKPAIIYSVSTDRKDDGGEAETPIRLNSPDFVFPLGPWPEPEDSK